MSPVKNYKKIRGIGFKQIPHYFYAAKSAEKAHIRNKDVSLANLIICISVELSMQNPQLC